MANSHLNHENIDEIKETNIINFHISFITFNHFNVPYY